MKLRLFYIGLLFVFVSKIFGQSRVVDSLLNLFNATNNKNQKVYFLLSIADNYKKVHDPKCVDYAKRSLQYTSQTGSDTNTFNALNKIGTCFDNLDNNDSANYYYKLAIAKRPITPSFKNKVALLYRKIAYNFDENQQIDSSIFYYNISSKLYLAIKDTAAFITVEIGKGDVYSYAAKIEKGLEYYIGVLPFAEKYSDKKLSTRLLRDIGWSFKDLKNYNMSQIYLRKSLSRALEIKSDVDIYYTYSYLSTLFSEIENADSLNKYVTLQEKYLDAVKDNYGSLHIFYINKAFNEYYKHNYLASEKNHFKALELVKKSTLKYDLSTSYYNIAEINYTMNNLKKALVYNDSAQLINTSYPNVTQSLNIYKLYRKLFYKTGDCKQALYYNDLFMALNDSILTKDMNDKISEMQAKYDVQGRDLKIDLLNKKNEISNKENEKNKQRLLYTIIIALLFVLLTVIAYIAFKRKQNDNKILTQQRKEIEEKTEQLNTQAAEIARHQSQMNPHFIFNALISIQKFILQENKQNAISYLSSLSKLMRLTLYNSEKELITLEEEIKFLNFYMDIELQRFSNKFEFSVSISKDVDEENTMIPPMIIQPFLENAIKHGVSGKENNGKIELRVSKTSHNSFAALKLEITDNGIGREASKKLAQKFNATHVSMAMNITKTRIENYADKYALSKEGILTISDVYDIDNNPAGTTITVILPYINYD